MSASDGVPAVSMISASSALDDLEDGLHAFLTERGEAPQIRPADADRARTESDRLEDVGPATKAAVDENRDLPVHRLHHLGKAVDGGAIARFRAAAVIRHDDPVDAVRSRERRVFLGHDALEEQLHLDQVPQAFHEVPVLAEVDVVLDPGEVDAVEHRFTANGGREGGVVVADAAIAVVYPGEALRRLPVGPDGEVDGENDDGAPRRLRPLDERFGDPPQGRGVELVPDGCPSSLGHVLHRRGRHRGEDLKMVLRPRRASHGDLSFRVKGLLASRGRDDDRTLPALAEDLGGDIDFRHVDEVACPDLDASQGLPVGGERSIVVDTGGEISVVCRWKRVAGDDLEIEDAFGLLR